MEKEINFSFIHNANRFMIRQQNLRLVDIPGMKLQLNKILITLLKTNGRK